MPPPPGEPSRNPIVRFLVWLYDQTWFHWSVSFLAQPVYGIMGVFYRLENRIWPIPFWKDWQNRPEPKFPIPETPHDLPVKTRLCDGCGSYVGTMIGTYVDAKNLETTLPAGTSLDPAHIHDGQHALIMLFGYTENLHFGWWPFRGMNYLECGVAVPHIRIDDNVEYVSRFFYIPILHLNRLYPVLLGWAVGYRKAWSRVTATFNTYSIRSLFRGEPILDATFTPCVNVTHEKTSHWKELMEEPHLNPFFGDKLFLHFHWDWTHADFQPVDATVTLHRDFPGIAAGTYTFKGMDLGAWTDGRAPIGSVRLTAPFELLLPFSLSKLRGHLQQNNIANPPSSAPPNPSPNAPPGAS